jgi:capsular polysaccharide biosynthesis protein
VPEPAGDLLPFLNERSGSVRYLQALRARWPMILVLVLVAVAAAVAYSHTATKRYQASADILVSPLPSSDETFVGFSLLRESLSEGQAVVTLARIIQSPQVVDRVDHKLHIGNAGSLINVTPLGQSNVVEIQASASRPERASLIANTFASQLIALRRATFQQELNARISDLRARLDVIP